jgi:MoxR-like ATPase
MANDAASPAPDDARLLDQLVQRSEALRARLAERIVGQDEVVTMLLAAVLAEGHTLLVGVPGLAKTLLVKTLAEALGVSFARVQFTPDLMPADLIGTELLETDDAGRRHLQFHPGPIFTQLLLADEINRTPPKTQAALLEAMQERRVTVGGETRPLSEPFFVLASQNPIDLEGTYPLPEAQVDRFLFKLQVQQPGVDVLEAILGTRRRGEAKPPEALVSEEQLRVLFGVMDRVLLPGPVGRYIARLVSASHPTNDTAPDGVKQYVTHGASPRAAIAMAESARAVALLAGRPTVGFEDVNAVAPHVLNHRLILGYQARFDGVSAHDVVAGLIDAIDEAAVELPRDVQVEAGA